MIFYELESVPVHSALVMDTLQEALSFARGDIVLGMCRQCGFISNITFDPSLHGYCAKYEPSQGCSETFNAFHRTLADDLIKRYRLYDKDIIEIGCGKGEFLALLCQAGGNRGLGFDPAYVDTPHHGRLKNKVRYVKDFYSEKYAGHKADFICCKMTLEHIHDVAAFVRMVRQMVDHQGQPIVFFQVPDVKRILNEIAFWDIYYEHCSYFSMGSLSRLFRRCGFEVIDQWRDYDDQYLMITARSEGGAGGANPALENDLEEISDAVRYFQNNYKAKLSKIEADLNAALAKQQRSVIWGAGSKGVAFLTTLKIQTEIQYAVDINPRKHGTFMAGTGQEIVAPEFLQVYQPKSVIVMNPIYCDEIRLLLDKLGVPAQLIPLA